ncbi:phosphate ABC transporter substrate-binding protein [Clostridium novyi A str. 4552]|uniref:Phosphate-binding protein n=1 Tax=Clostridium novyi A str. 4552 TaxID=1444289 RepID=A0A0A0I3Y3_CLONO|nr:phosphate ABC transporter substrate-binding protein [Clostridium novyi]KGM96094.1 phosphate ABC transporter substrate-binding protein [Clostridium novyi A str. 4552]
MNKKSLKNIMLFSVICTMIIFLSSCNKDSNKFITISGSTALQPVVNLVANEFMNKNSEIQINVQGGGSGTGLSQVVSGAVTIGNSDFGAEEKIKDKNILKQLVDHRVAISGFVMVVNKDIKVESLTKEQIQDIFTGKITNWKEICGDNEEIQVINRGKSSGSRATFIKTVMDGKVENPEIGTIQDSSGSVQKSVKETKGAISYLALSYFKNENVKEGINIIKINNVDATEKNISSDKYPFWSYEHMYTKGIPEGVVKSFINYMYSSEGKRIIKETGYIPIDSIK